MERLLEVIACTVADAEEAEAGGAHRIEFVRNLEMGGLTPPVALVREVLAAVSIPVRVMVRESERHEVNDPSEKGRLRDAARAFADLGVAGLVLGFRRGGRVDLDFTAGILACAPGLGATFHRAFEELADPLRGIADLKTLPRIDRILTGGGDGSRADKLARLRSYVDAASPEITILAGGGITKEEIVWLVSSTPLREFHAGRAARLPATTDGAVDRTRVRSLLRALAAPE